MKTALTLIGLFVMVSCGAPAARVGPAADAGRAVHMSRFSLRYQTGSLRFLEVTGDSAAFGGAEWVEMDSVQMSLYRDNLRFAGVTSPRARVRTGAGDSAIIAIADPSGKIYFGGAFEAAALKVSIGEGSWTAEGRVEFHREPLSLTADAAHGPLGLETLFAERARIRTPEAAASADRLTFLPGRLLFLLHGRAEFVSDSVILRSDTLTLRLDPTYSHLTPLRG